MGHLQRYEQSGNKVVLTASLIITVEAPAIKIVSASGFEMAKHLVKEAEAADTAIPVKTKVLAFLTGAKPKSILMHTHAVAVIVETARMPLVVAPGIRLIVDAFFTVIPAAATKPISTRDDVIL